MRWDFLFIATFLKENISISLFFEVCYNAIVIIDWHEVMPFSLLASGSRQEGSIGATT